MITSAISVLTDLSEINVRSPFSYGILDGLLMLLNQMLNQVRIYCRLFLLKFQPIKKKEKKNQIIFCSYLCHEGWANDSWSISWIIIMGFTLVTNKLFIEAATATYKRRAARHSSRARLDFSIAEWIRFYFAVGFTNAHDVNTELYCFVR